MCENDIDDQNKIDNLEFCEPTKHNNDGTVPVEPQLAVHCQQQQLHDNDVTVVPAEQKLEVLSDRQQQQQHDVDVTAVSAKQQLVIHSDRQLQHPVSVLANYCVEEYLQDSGNGQGNTIEQPGEKHSQLIDCNNSPVGIPAGILKITQLTIDLFDNNYHLYARKISCPVDGFFIRAVLLKNNDVIFNYTYKIIGIENVCIATIVSADQVCNHYLPLAIKSNTFQVSLGDGHAGVNVPIIRNAHLANFIKTLNKVKVITGLYTIVSGHKFDWLQYASHNTINQELFIAPDKTTIIPTIVSYLNEKWYTEWSNLKGQAQTKYWLPKPDSFLATKLLQMSRKHLGINIQFFSGHGWWRRHLMTAKLSKDDQCRLCLEDQAVKCPIHLFSECPALAWLRQELFNDSYPTQLMGQQSLCQVTELALHGLIQDLIERTDQNSNLCLTE